MFIISIINKLLTFVLMILSVLLLFYSYFYVYFPVLFPFFSVLTIFICFIFLFFDELVYIYTSIDVGNNLLMFVILFPLFLLLYLNFISLPKESNLDMDKRLREVSGSSSQTIDNKFISSYTIITSDNFNILNLNETFESVRSYKLYYIESKDKTFIIEAESLRFGYLDGNLLETSNILNRKDFLEILH